MNSTHARYFHLYGSDGFEDVAFSFGDRSYGKLESFSWDAIAKQTIQAYQKILTNK
ncbi:MAG TPA: hypothetical protein VE944_15670 [Nostoc sp.]|uniref:hypothetical protein n=1 Tax=Nostoc sp. TaxID=1180 RepID=UPI002D273F8A|nr:hypothetical protein [Nostoc sp.]HYX15772.1 hypothetical protein [Nostoc sp.]